MRKRHAAPLLVLAVVAAATILAWRLDPAQRDVPSRSREFGTVPGAARGAVVTARPRLPRSDAFASTDETSTAIRITGRVVETESETPIAGAEVAVMRAPSEWSDDILDLDTSRQPETTATTGADGAFDISVTGVAPRSIVTRAAGHAPAWTAVQGDDPITIRLAPAVTRRLVVFAQIDGLPVPNAEVLVYGPDFRGPPLVRLLTDESGGADVRIDSSDSLVVHAAGFV